MEWWPSSLMVITIPSFMKRIGWKLPGSMPNHYASASTMKVGVMGSHSQRWARGGHLGMELKDFPGKSHSFPGKSHSFPWNYTSLTREKRSPVLRYAMRTVRQAHRIPKGSSETVSLESTRATDSESTWIRNDEKYHVFRYKYHTYSYKIDTNATHTHWTALVTTYSLNSAGASRPEIT